MGKIMVSLTDECENILRTYVKVKYAGKRGALSWVIEQLIRENLTKEKEDRVA